MIESYIIESRRLICSKCEREKECGVSKVFHSLFSDETKCPEKRHLSRANEIAKKAWPESAPSISGCCDRADSL